MLNNSLTEKENKALYDLIITSSYQLKNYRKMIQLELENKKNSQEYDELLSNQQFLGECFDEIVERLDSNECNSLINYIKTENPKTEEKFRIDEMVILGNEDPCYKKILIALKNQMDKDEMQVDILQINPIDKITEMMKRELGLKNITSTDIAHVLNNEMELSKLINQDILTLYLNVLQKYIEQGKYDSIFSFKNEREMQELYNYLLEAKYRIPFLNRNIEKKMLENHFIMSDIISLKSSELANYFGFTYDMYLDEKNISCHIHFIDQLNMIINIKDNDYNSIYSKAMAMLLQCLLEAEGIFMDQYHLDMIKEEYKAIIDSPTCYSEEIIKNSLSAILKGQKTYQLIINYHHFNEDTE